MRNYHLRVVGGLCNRLRAIASGLKWAESKGARLVVHWRLDDAMNTDYSKLFDCENLPFRLIERDETFFDKLGFSTKLASCIPWQWPWKTSFENWLGVDDFSFVRPKRELNDEIAKIAKRFPSSCVGVHIRRTDNAEAIKKSPLEVFISEMRRAEADGANGFFVATDGEVEKGLLRAEFGEEKIVTRENVAKRESSAGVSDAVIDLWLLASTKKVIGSHWSSFSEVAAQIGHVPLIVAELST